MAMEEEQFETLIRENERLRIQLDQRGRELTEIVRDEIEYKVRIKELYERNDVLKNENQFLRTLVMQKRSQENTEKE
jgi:hypothetical protein